MLKSNLTKMQIFANLVAVVTITLLFLVKTFVIDTKDTDKQNQRNKKQLHIHIDYTYKKDLKNLNRVLKKKVKFFSEHISSLQSNEKKKSMFLFKKHKQLKEVFPSLVYIAIYNKDLQSLHVSKIHNIQNKQYRHILEQIVSKNNNKILTTLEKSNDGKVFLVYAVKIPKTSKDIEMVEIVVDITYLKKGLLEEYSKADKNFTFDLLLWENKVGYDDLLIKNIQILNYKSLVPFNYQRLITPFMALTFILLLINFLSIYLIKKFEKEKRKVQDIINSQSSLIVIFTKNKIISCNKSFMKALGFETEEELILNHQEVSDFFIPQDEFEISMKKDDFWADYAIENKKDDFYELFLKDRYGNKIDIFDVSASLYMIDNNEQYYIVVFMNASIRYKKKKAFSLEKEQQEQIMKDKIAQGIEELNEQQHLLAHQSKLASMGEMIGSIAHQWRQPLNELGIKVQSLKFQYKKGLIDEEFIKDFIAQNKTTIMFMSKTIDDFRNFYRTDKEKKDFSILEAIKFCFSMQSSELKNKNIIIDISGDDFIYHGYDSEFKQVILNLINNSKDALGENNIKDGKINILIENKQILFTDNAGGIPDSILLRIFEPYFTTKEQGKGTGIGLHMSKSIVENNDGTLSVKNTNNGACFTIDFSGGGLIRRYNL